MNYYNNTQQGKKYLRAKHEFYTTPPEATRALLSVEEFDGPIWEPACGNGMISEVLETAGHTVESTDLILRGYGGQLDFLESRAPLWKDIITNPPYGKHGLGDAFVRKALEYANETGGKVAMLLNLRSIAHPSRTEKFQNSPPANVYVLDDLHCWPNGIPPKDGERYGRQQYYWAVWKPGRQQSTQLSWLSPAKFREAQDTHTQPERAPNHF